MSEKIKASPVAKAIPFDASGTDLSAANVEDAIKEVKYITDLALIPQVDADPIAPVATSSWVLKEIDPPGTALGLLLALTSATTRNIYRLSYRTLEGETVRTELLRG